MPIHRSLPWRVKRNIQLAPFGGRETKWSRPPSFNVHCRFVARPIWICESLCIGRAFERLFRERGLPLAIRSDNGVPFASPNALFNLSKLSVWWLRLGIAIERIKPGHPQQTGRHERMHLNLKKGNNPATGLQQPAAAGTLRCLRPRVQCRTAA